MDPFSTTPTYNLKAVVQRTGIKPDTLRMWERRYGLPSPHRKSSGHRLYSERDIAVICWLLARQDEGVRIGEAVRLWKQLEAQGQDPLVAAPVISASAISLKTITGAPHLESLRGRWLDAVLAFDERRADAILDEAFALYAPELVVLSLLCPAMREIGERWYQGKLSIQQEHFASALVLRRLSAMLGVAPPPLESRSVLVACVAEEEHALPALILTFLLRRRGMGVIYLGANVPDTHLISTVHSLKPWLVVLIAQQLFTAANLADMADLLAAQGVHVAYGGRIFALQPSIRRYLRGTYLGDSLEEAVESVSQLAHTSTPTPYAPPLPSEMLEMLRRFRASLPLIMAFIWQRLQTETLPKMAMSGYGYPSAIYFLSRDIEAAMRLGSMEILGDELQWARMLLLHHKIPTETLQHFVHLYCEAVTSLLGEAGQMAAEWLTRLEATLA